MRLGKVRDNWQNFVRISEDGVSPVLNRVSIETDWHSAGSSVILKVVGEVLDHRDDSIDAIDNIR